MSDFIKFRDAVDKRIQRMSKSNALRANISGDELWEIYLNAFPPGTDPMFRERTEHDCNCCKQFIRDVGNMVTVTLDNRVETIWDVKRVGEPYQTVADVMANAVASATVSNVFLHTQMKVGVARNRAMKEGGVVEEYDHFCTVLDPSVVVDNDDIGSVLSQRRSDIDVLKRSLLEITNSSVEVVMDLIDQNSIYRGQEHKSTVKLLQDLKAESNSLTETEFSFYCAKKAAKLKHAARIRNTVIGTLLTDISEGVDLEKAVKSFESKVAPTNYKRTTALITQKMIDAAQKKVAQLGLEDALSRRFATADDLTINNVLFADRSSKAKMGGVFDELKPTATKKKPNLDKVQEVSIHEFMEKILPKADGVELLIENKHQANFVSLIAPTHPSAPNILAWDNNFSWSYAGEVTDSIKEKVKAAGGKVDAPVRASLSWFNYDDLDIHMLEPSGNVIFYGSRNSNYGGRLDVDMNAGGGSSRDPVENIYYKNTNAMKDGEYKVVVHNFRKRETTDVGFAIEIEVNGVLHELHHPKAVPNDNKVHVATIVKSGNTFTVDPKIPSTSTPKEIWGISTQEFVPVEIVMNSPNHWNDQEIGNKHWFFMLKDCVNPDAARGFYNEFLRNELTRHRKVFEVLSSKIKTPYTTNQLSGLGFSSTKRDVIMCRVLGSFNRVIAIKF